MKKSIFIVALTLAVNAAFSLFLFNNLEKQLSADDGHLVKNEIEGKSVPVHFTNYKENLNTSPSNYTTPFALDFVPTSKKVTPGVVNITAISKNGYPLSGGSGVIISSDGYIITNNHVVDGSGGVLEVTLSNNRTFRAKLIGVDPTTDLALIKVRAQNLPTVKYGNSDAVEVGEWVLAVGNPFNLASTVTAGIVSAKGRNINILEGQYSIESFIQTDAVVNPGNSGGALVNNAGELVGINTAIISESGGYEGYSFAIPANLVKKVVQDLREYGEVRRAILGVGIADVNGDIAETLGLPSVEGVYIRTITKGGSAQQAGIESGDVIVAVNGTKTVSMSALQEQIARYRPGEKIDIDLIRDGRKIRKYDVVLKTLQSPSSAYRE